MRQGTLIAVKRGSVNDNIISYRIKGSGQFKGKVIDVNKEQLIGVLTKVPDAIDNIKLTNGDIEFTNGSSKRYTNLNNLGTGNDSLVILNKYTLKSKGNMPIYILCDFKGETMVADEAMAVVYMRRFGIANGKLVNRENKVIISSIQGEYPTQDLSEQAEDYYFTQLQTPTVEEKLSNAAEFISNDEQQALDEQRRLKEAEELRLADLKNRNKQREVNKVISVNKNMKTSTGIQLSLEPVSAEDLSPFITSIKNCASKKGLECTTYRDMIETINGIETPVDMIDFPAHLGDKGEECRYAIGVYGYIATAPNGKSEIILYNMKIRNETEQSPVYITKKKLDCTDEGKRYIDGDRQPLNNWLYDYGFELADYLEQMLKTVKEMDPNSMTSLLKGTSSILKTVFGMKKR